MTLNRRAYVAVILFALGLALVVALGIREGWGAFRKPTKESVVNADAANLAALDPGKVDLASVDLQMAIVPPSSEEEVRKLTLQLVGVQYFVRDDSADLDVTNVCVDGVDILVNPDNLENSAVYSFLDEPLCAEPFPEEYEEGPIDLGGAALDHFYRIALDLEQPSSFEIKDPDIISLNFWYPYDNFTIRSAMVVTYSVERSDGTIIADTIRPYINWDIQTSGTRAWDVRFQAETVPLSTLGISDFQSGTYESLTINVARSWLYRLVFPFFIVAMVLLIAMVPLLGERDTLVDICAAMLFGIFGLKGILGPGEQMGQTILDISLIGLYMVLAFAAALFFINKIIARRQQKTG